MLYSFKAAQISSHVILEPKAECHFVAVYTKQLLWSLIILSLMHQVVREHWFSFLFNER